MEKLILKCGRYVPASAADTAVRIAAMEAYLSRLTDELEHLLSELDLALRAVTETGEEG